MKLTIGMASYKNYEQVWFTLQALRLYQDLKDVELLVIDNSDETDIEQHFSKWFKNTNMRYVRWTDVQGPANAKNRIFVEARGEWVLAIDSHVLLGPDVVSKFKNWIEKNNDSKNLYHGPLVYDCLVNKADAMNDVWHGNSWGTWRNVKVDPESDPYTIPMHGMGLFACRKDAWLGFNPHFKGFGGEEGYIHTKYRKAGHDVLLLPFLDWVHMFQTRNGKVSAPYKPLKEDKIRNYKIGFLELGLDLKPLYSMFTKNDVDACKVLPHEVNL